MNHTLIICLLFFGFFSNSNTLFAQHSGNSRYVPHPQEQRKNPPPPSNHTETEDMGNVRPVPTPPAFVPSPIQAGTFYFNNSEMMMDVNILLNAKADYQVAIFSLREEHATLQTCQDSMQKRIDAFTNKLLALGIPAAYIHVDVITQIPVYGYDIKVRQGSYQTAELPIAFELKKNIHVRYNDDKLSNPIMDAAAKAGIYDLAKVDYVVSDLQKVNSELRSKANELLKKRLEAYKDLGVNILGLIGLQNEMILQYYPGDRYTSYAAFNGTSLNAMQNMQGVSEKLIEGIRQGNAQKHTTYYYDKIPFTRYDAVINPDVIGPVIQFIYQIQVRYRVKPN